MTIPTYFPTLEQAETDPLKDSRKKVDGDKTRESLQVVLESGVLPGVSLWGN